MPLASRHEAALRGLTPKQFVTLRDQVARAFSLRPKHKTPEDLILFCRAPTAHPADLAAPFFRSTDELGVAILEALMGHKITRSLHIGGKAPPSSRKGKKPRPLKDARSAPPPSSRRGLIVRVLVEGNPHKPSSAVYVRWMGYRDGATVDEVVTRGVRMCDIKFHEKQGWVKVVTPEEYAKERERERRTAQKVAA